MFCLFFLPKFKIKRWLYLSNFRLARTSEYELLIIFCFFSKAEVWDFHSLRPLPSLPPPSPQGPMTWFIIPGLWLTIFLCIHFLNLHSSSPSSLPPFLLPSFYPLSEGICSLSFQIYHFSFWFWGLIWQLIPSPQIGIWWVGCFIYLSPLKLKNKAFLLDTEQLPLLPLLVLRFQESSCCRNHLSLQDNWLSWTPL